MLNVRNFSGQFVDLALGGDYAAVSTTFLDYATMALPEPSFGLWHEGGFLLCSSESDKGCRQYNLHSGNWYVLESC